METDAGPGVKKLQAKEHQGLLTTIRDAETARKGYSSEPLEGVWTTS